MNRGGANARGAGRAGTRRGRRVPARAILQPTHPRAEDEIANSSPRRGATAGMPPRRPTPSQVDLSPPEGRLVHKKSVVNQVRSHQCAAQNCDKWRFRQTSRVRARASRMARSSVFVGSVTSTDRLSAGRRGSRARSPNPPARRRISSTDPRFCSSSPCQTLRRTPWPSPSSSSPSPPCSSCSWP